MTNPPGFKDLKNITIVLFITTVFVTSYRCYARYTKGLWWHDDSVALFSVLSFIIFLIGSIYLAEQTPSPEVRTAGTYLLAVGFYVPIWGARISIALTMVRITPWRLQRTILIWAAVIFFLLFTMLTVQLFWVCELTYNGWKQIPGAICLVPRVVPISLVVTTIISDVTLVAAPLMIARGIHIPALRFRLFSIFSVSIATTLASVAHATLVLVKPGVWEAIFGGVESAVAIIVCNMSVIIPAILRALGVGDPFMQEDTVDPKFTTGVEIARMTTSRIELGLLTSRGTVVTDGSTFRGAISTVASPQRDSVDSDARDQEHRLRTQASHGSLGNFRSTSRVEPLVDGSDVAHPLAQVRSLPVLGKDQNVEADVGRRHTKNNST